MRDQGFSCFFAATEISQYSHEIACRNEFPGLAPQTFRVRAFEGEEFVIRAAGPAQPIHVQVRRPQPFRQAA